MSFNDDEQIVSQDSGPRPIPIVPGRVQLISRNNNMAPLEESPLKVMLELTGGDSSNRPGLDLVAVLDVSGSMAGEKLRNLKKAMLFMIKKLSPIDRLSVVTFSTDANRLCPLRQITETSQTELENLIKDLKDDSFTNISAGLQTGLKVLNDRSLSGGRVIGIMLMSDGWQNEGGDAAQVPVGNVPVHTFSFGTDAEPRVLNDIAKKSLGGTFSAVSEMGDLSLVFSQYLAGLLTVVVQDLSLTVTRIKNESTIEQVFAGSYPQSKDAAAGSITVTFRDLYCKEVRKVIVDLLLPAVDKERVAAVLEISYGYRIRGHPFEAPPATLTIRRTGPSTGQEERPEVITEETRLQTAKRIKEARVMADDGCLKDARGTLVKAQNSLEDVVDASNPLVGMLKIELQQLLKLMKSQQIYEEKGLPFALSSETSHDRQRFAARGDFKSLRLFATPRMDKYLGQTRVFDADPSKPPPSVDDDVKEELVDNPLAPIAGPFSFYIQAAFQSLQAIEKKLKRGL